MKTVISIILLTVSFSASALMIPVKPTPELITHCSIIGATVTCTNGVRCTLDGSIGDSGFANCSNGVICSFAGNGNVSCNNGDVCSQTGMNLYCHQGLTCTQSGPASYSCRM